MLAGVAPPQWSPVTWKATSLRQPHHHQERERSGDAGRKGPHGSRSALSPEPLMVAITVGVAGGGIAALGRRAIQRRNARGLHDQTTWGTRIHSVGSIVYNRLRGESRSMCRALTEEDRFKRLTTAIAQKGKKNIGNPFGAVAAVSKIKRAERKGIKAGSDAGRLRLGELRRQEIGLKIGILKGRKKQEQLKAMQIQEKEEEGEEELEELEELEERSDTRKRGGRKELRYTRYEGEATADRSFEWTTQRIKRTNKDPEYELSNETRAVLAHELEGDGISSSTQIRLATKELAKYEEWENVALLLEIGRKRLDKEMLEREIDYKKAAEIDVAFLSLLAEAYERLNRLNVSRETLLMLRNYLSSPSEIEALTLKWMNLTLDYGNKLMGEARDSAGALKVFEEGVAAETQSYRGRDMREELQLHACMAMLELGQRGGLLEKLQVLAKRSISAKRCRKAAYVLEVASVENVQPDGELRKLWEDSVVLPGKGSPVVLRGTGARTASGSRRLPKTGSHLSDFQVWAQGYWEERMKSPAYYAFLVLWVTWPFAIPVLSIAKRMDLMQ